MTVLWMHLILEVNTHTHPCLPIHSHLLTPAYLEIDVCTRAARASRLEHSITQRGIFYLLMLTSVKCHKMLSVPV